MYTKRAFKEDIKHFHDRWECPECSEINMEDNTKCICGFTRSTGGCFIATAVYDSPMAENVIVLKQFRDEVLLASSIGQNFVSSYYRFSPPMASFLAEHAFLKYLVKYVLIAPIVFLIRSINMAKKW